MAKKTIPSIKVEEQTIRNMESAMTKFNKDKRNIILIKSFLEFRRFSYELFSQMILQNKVIPIKLK